MAVESNVTELLNKYKEGNREVLDELFPIVYDELRRVAQNKLKNERESHTLQATALVHEAYLRLIEQHSVDWQSRAQFFSIAAEMMRRILVNHANERNAEKRGGHETRILLDEAVSFAQEENEIDLVSLDDALTRLAALDGQQARITELRFFGGLNIEETAEVLKISVSTVNREWRMAKAWLYEQMKNEK